ncbi:MAG: hypothetical protein PUE51_06055 [Veillonellaceae bacterium]|nr:hypothetical protein [Veillonellaceae bacterium]
MKNGDNYRPLEGWAAFAESTGKHGYTDYVKPGDIVDKATYNHFCDCLPPAAFGRGYLQMGETFNHICTEDGRAVPTFLTFARGEDGELHFCGDLPYRRYRKDDGKGEIAIWPGDVL